MIKKNENSKILIIGNLYDDPVPEIRLKKLLKIIQNFFNVKVIAGDIFKDSIDENKFDRENKSIFGLIYESLRRQLKAIKLISKKDFDQALILLPFLIIPILYIKIIKRKPVILYIGGRASKSIIGEIKTGAYLKLPLYILIKFIEEFALAISDMILVDSISSTNFLDINQYSGKINICSNYIDMEKFRPKTKFKDRKQILGYIGRLENEKGIWEFIKAAELIVNSNESINILIGGNGTLYSKIRNYVDSNPRLSEKTDFRGWIEPNIMPDVLNDLYLLILPSYSEGTPNIILESMACGTPVLSTAVGGVPEIISNNENGFIINKNDYLTISKKVFDILKNDKMENISEKAILTIKKKYNPDKIIEEHRKIFYGY